MNKFNLAVIVNHDSNITVMENKGPEMETLDEIGVPYRIVGYVCSNDCTTDCHFMRSGTCPFFIERDITGKLVYVKRIG